MKVNNKIIIRISIVVALFLAILILLFISSKNNAQNQGILVVETIPPEAKILINGKEFRDKEEIVLKSGEYRIIIKKDSFIEQEQSVTIESEKTNNVNVTLRKYLSIEEKNFIKFLPIRNANYDISYTILDDGTVEYTIKLHAINNGYSWQQSIYKDQLAAYKSEALKWITSQSFAPETLKIKYIPDEAKNL